MSSNPEKQKLLAEQRKTNLLKKQIRRDIQQGRIKHGREGIIRVPKTFRRLPEFETWLHHEVSLKPSVIPREYVGYFTKEGEYQGYIRIDPDELTGKVEWKITPAMERQLRGKIVTHNHPSGYTFSYNEVLTCIDLEYNEFRVITEHYSYSLKPRNGEWPPLETISEIFAKEISQDGDARHKCYEILAEHGYFEYERNPLFY